VVKSNGLKLGEAREFWEEALRLWAETGLSVRAFCRREGLAEHSFYSWRRRLPPENASIKANQESKANRESSTKDGGEVIVKTRSHRLTRKVAETASKDAAAVEFVPVHVLDQEVAGVRPTCAETPAAASPIEIVHASGWRVRIPADFDSATLAAVLTVLERRERRSC
jgi:transposase-like protein